MFISVCSSGDESEGSEGEEEEEGQEEVKMVLVVRNDLKMGKGKVGTNLAAKIDT